MDAISQPFVHRHGPGRPKQKAYRWIGLAIALLPVFLHAQDTYVSQYNATFTEPPKLVPTSKTPDAPLTGNGDIGLTLGGTPDKLCFYLGKNDFWRAYPVYPGGGIAFPGALTVSINALTGASYRAEQLMGEGAITGQFVKENQQVHLRTWVSATRNMVFIELTSRQPCAVKLDLWTTSGNTSLNRAGTTGGVAWATRSFEKTPLLEWPCHIAIAMKVLGASWLPNRSFVLQPNKKVILALVLYTSFDRSNWKEAALAEARSLTPRLIQQVKKAHESWWKQFWSRSNIRVEDPYLEKYYYTSQYLFASASRGNKFAPGLWGPFITKDSAAWGGDYHLNYNYQAPYWAAYSSNHIDLTHNYDQPLLDYMVKGKKHAQDLLQVGGIYYPVGIGPKGLVTTRWPLTPEEMEKRYGTREHTIDGGYKFLGQKINAVFGTGNMFMRFYSTYDSSYAERIYPYLLECASFWEDYLKFENGRYVIYGDHFNEVMPRLNQTGNWRDRLGDFNSTLSLGLVKMLFRGLLDVSRYLHKEENRQPKWEHIVANLSAFPLGEVAGRPSLKSMERGPAGPVQPAGLNRVSIHGLLLPGGVAGYYTDASFNEVLLGDIAHWKDKAPLPGTWGNTLGNGIETCFPGAVRVGYDPDTILKELKARIAAQSLPNGWITQAGGGIETLSAVPLTINEMLLQSYEGVVRVFPNWPPSKDASFKRLRAYGAFVISSSVKKGQIQYVQLLSEKGRPCTLENPWLGKGAQLVRNGKKAELLKGKLLRFSTKENEVIRITAAGVHTPHLTGG